MRVKTFIIFFFIVATLFAQDKRKVGLIPFVNESGSKYDWISYGFEYYLYNKLEVLSGFYVPDKKTFHQVLKEVGSGKNALDERQIYHIGRASGVEVLVSGKYKVQSGKIIINISYNNAINGSSLFTSTYSEPMANFFVLGRKIVDDLINLSGINVTSLEKRLLDFKITSSITAYGSFIKAYMENEKSNPRNEVIIGLFKKSIREDPKFWEAYYNLGIIYFNSGHYQQALQQFNKVITALPNFDKPYFGRGLIYEQQREYEKAIADFKKVTEFNPNDFKPFYYLGKISVSAKKYADAEKYLKKAKTINPDYAPIYFELGNIYYNQNKYRKCIEYYKDAVKLDDKNALYHLKLGDSFYRSQIYYNALTEINASIKINPGNSSAYFLKGITIYKQAVLEELIKAFLDLLDESKKKNTSVRPASRRKPPVLDPVKKKQIYLDMADAFSNAIRVKPDFMEATFNLALTYHEMKDYHDAEKYYFRTIQIQPNLIRAHLKLAELYTETKRNKEAIDQYRRIFYINPAFFVSQPTLGPEHQYINVLNKFRRELEDKLQVEPDNPEYNLTLAKLFNAKGEYGKAANLVRKVLSINPNNREAKILLASIQKATKY